MLFIASTLTIARAFLPSNCRSDRLDVVAVVVERVVEEDRLEGSRARGIVAREGVDVHALAGVRDRVVVHVQVDRLTHERAASRERGESACR